MRSFIWGAVGALTAAAVITSLMIALGAVPVSASKQEPRLFAWLLHTAYEQRIATMATDIEIPPETDAERTVLEGARSFDEMCSTCHTVPGKPSTVVSQGLNPPPPELQDLMAHRTPEEAFWVIKNGVRMTGMPAFGPTHADQSLWALVVFLKKARSLDGEGYAQLVRTARATESGGDGHDHRHSSGQESLSGQEISGPRIEAEDSDKREGHDHTSHDH